MRLQKKLKINLRLNLQKCKSGSVIFILGLCFFNPVSHSQVRTNFRTPAKLYGTAYSIKVTLKRDGTEFVAPFWVKPDQAQSSIDLKMMAELGWYYQDARIDEMKLADQVMTPPPFKKMKSDWAFVPEFPRTCCYGILGQDFLKRYQILFSPNLPTHLEWNELDDVEEASKKKAPASLASLFNLHSDVVEFQKAKLDLADVPYELNLARGQLQFKASPTTPKQKKLWRKLPIFKFSIMPPIRILKITSIDASVLKSAQAVGLKLGSVIWGVQSESVIFLDQFFIQRALKGRNDAKLELLVSDSLKISKRRTVFFDFEKGEFYPDPNEKSAHELKK